MSISFPIMPRVLTTRFFHGANFELNTTTQGTFLGSWVGGWMMAIISSEMLTFKMTCIDEQIKSNILLLLSNALCSLDQISYCKSLKST